MPITFLYIAELVARAERYDTEARIAVHTDIAPQDTILREVKQHRFDLVVMGVNHRPGEALFFGNGAGAMIEDAEVSVLLLSS